MFLWEKKKTLFYYVRKMNLNMESGCMKSEQMEMCLGLREYMKWWLRLWHAVGYWATFFETHRNNQEKWYFDIFFLTQYIYRRHGYSEHFMFVIFVGFVTIVDILPLYAINVDAVSLFTDSSFLVFSNLELYCSIYFINLNEWMNIVFNQKKKKSGAHTKIR
jgi:hypothetical protein